MLRSSFIFASALVVIICGSAYAETDEEFCRGFPSEGYAPCMTSRDYMAKAKGVVAGNGLCLPDRPKGFSVRYLLPGDDTVITEAVKISLSSLFGERPCKKQ